MKPFAGPSRATVADFRKSAVGVTFNGDDSKDLVRGSRFADTILGGTGSDALFGFEGNDTLEGGAGLDLAVGGAGSDNFMFRPGDLIASTSRKNGYDGFVDTIQDFQGAGTSGSGEQDVIRLEGFGEGTSLQFVSNGSTALQQLYEVIDPTTAGADGFLLVGMAGGSTNRLGAGDVVFVPRSDAPVFGGASYTFGLDENNAVGAAVDTAAATDTASGALTYTIDENEDGDPNNNVPFAISASGAITATEAFDHEARVSYTFTVRATDAGDLSDTAVVTVNVGDINETPAFADASYTFDLNENNVLGAVVGTTAATDPDEDTLTYTIDENEDDLLTNDVPFAISASGAITATGALDYEAAASHTFTVRATDVGGLSDTAAVTVDVGDLVSFDLDFAVPHYIGSSASVRLGYEGGFTVAPEVAVGADPWGLALGDLNGDGFLDLAITNRAANTVSVRLNDREGGFTTSPNLAVGGRPYEVAMGDLNKDGDLDFVTANWDTSNISVRLGNGDGTFTTALDVAVGANPMSVAIGDLNGDGNLDLATANYFGNSVSVRLGDGEGGFTAADDITAGMVTPRDVVMGDLNGDGILDLASSISTGVRVWLGTGDGSFTTAGDVVAVGVTPSGGALGDLNRDGKLDLAVANGGSRSVSIRLGDGNGGFTGTVDLAVGTTPTSVAMGDLDGDGDLDLAVSNSNSSTISVWLGVGDGTFTSSDNVNVGALPFTVALGDLDGLARLTPSGLPDLGPYVPTPTEIDAAWV